MNEAFYSAKMTFYRLPNDQKWRCTRLPRFQALDQRTSLNLLSKSVMRVNTCQTTMQTIHQIVNGLFNYVGILLFLIALGNFLDKEKFQALVRSKLDSREQHLLNTQNLTMEVDKEFAEIFHQTQMISSRY